ncbi:MAG: C39 family peptidase [Patescibacteria group bacterium]|nr:C39 family peptidase [Patescibacteria group bacterium]
MLKKFSFITIVLFFLLYSFFWFKLFEPSKKIVLESPVSKYLPFNIVANNLSPARKIKNVLSSNTNQTAIPESYKINLALRKQAFNLSCEFAAAASIIYHLTNNPDFSAVKEQQAEKTLMEKIGVSENPNIGIRMGKTIPASSEALLNNLNERFGGTDYYGVHAPPFIELFNSYGLPSKLLDKNQDIVSFIKNAIYKNHLVMAWIKIGFGSDIDMALSYGVSVPIIKGEHTVVITGYNQNGVFIMDPGSGRENYIDFSDLLEATENFPFPFLEVPSSSSFSLDPNGKQKDEFTGLSRSIVKIRVENASKIVGKGSEMADILKDFGYTLAGVENSKCTDCENIQVKIKGSLKDYAGLLKRDLNFASFNIENISFDLSSSDSADMVVTVGK